MSYLALSHGSFDKLEILTRLRWPMTLAVNPSIRQTPLSCAAVRQLSLPLFQSWT